MDGIERQWLAVAGGDERTVLSRFVVIQKETLQRVGGAVDFPLSRREPADKYAVQTSLFVTFCKLECLIPKRDSRTTMKLTGEEWQRQRAAGRGEGHAIGGARAGWGRKGFAERRGNPER